MFLTNTIYLSNKLRSKYGNIIGKLMKDIHQSKYKCILSNGLKNISKNIEMGELIGVGNWGNVYSAMVKDGQEYLKFAIKLSKITVEDLEDPYSSYSMSWYEVLMLRDIIKPLIERGICPNLPLIIDTIVCDKCELVVNKKIEIHPCVATMMELADENLHQYLTNNKPTNDELYSALFQIMAGLHAIQKYGQILNNDIKAKNILCYKVTSGGYWKYRINNYDFYVPNYGTIFILNDFGVSNIYSPNFQLYSNKDKKVFNLGSRYAININGIFSPLMASVEYDKKKDEIVDTKKIKWLTGDTQHTSRGATFSIDKKTDEVISSDVSLSFDQMMYMHRKGITNNPTSLNFFSDSIVLPPFEFYNDTQDVLRIFTGGKRTTQAKYHMLYPNVSKTVRSTISKYEGYAENFRSKIFSYSAYNVLAGHFISTFFREGIDYTKKRSGTQIEFYKM